MSIFDAWTIFYKIHKETTKLEILKEHGHKLAVRASIAIYIATSFAALIIAHINFFAAFLLTVCSALLISTTFTALISKDIPQLKLIPFFSRVRYARLLAFKAKLEKQKLSEALIDKAIQWNDIEDEKFNTREFLTNPATLVFLSAIINFIFSSDKIKPQAFETGLIIAYIFFCILILAWMLQDLANSSKRKKFEICRFIKWYKLELEVANTQTK